MSCAAIIAPPVRGLPMARGRVRFRMGIGGAEHRIHLNSVFTMWWV